MASSHTNQQAESRRDRAPNTSPSEADRRKLQDLELALAKAQRELGVFCMETNQTSSLLLVEDATQDNVQEHPAPECDTDNCCQRCGSPYESEPVAQREHQSNIPAGASCVITRVLNAAPQLQTRYTNTTTGGSNDGDWYLGSPEGGLWVLKSVAPLKCWQTVFERTGVAREFSSRCDRSTTRAMTWIRASRRSECAGRGRLLSYLSPLQFNADGGGVACLLTCAGRKRAAHGQSGL
ncbi:uncharacterized protein FMAN_09914 [Fusarium mangiferae]|uniref:Uncharacterized protein n=1 Tax=Fusarium mangiferae TaxID=192010 RepID=A0A1L7TYM3_FUSMA|nr:uncharacterized protein FMAN_09914 [Fusarium mangiferae]CVL00487.1 uncharacterized protein FMAN_09914 [Fusarium mangiferae]